jgi:hypothetical protein
MADIPISQLATPSGEMPDSVGSNSATPSASKTPSGKAEDSEALAGEVNSKYTRWRADRRPYEQQWFYSAALIRGLFNVKFNPVLNVLESRKAPSHRTRDPINIILPKVKAKLSKFLKSRAIPVVQAASTDHEDILNAQATTKVLEYLWDKLMLEEKYEEALLWAMQTGKSFWWFRWDESKLGSVKSEPDILGKTNIEDIPLGDIAVELGTAFEVLISDPGITRAINQPEIMRVKAVLTADLEKQFKLAAGSITAEIKESDLFQYQRQIATLGAKAITGMSSNLTGGDKDEQAKYSVRKELFTAPCVAYPNGRYVVVAGNKVLLNSPELPYGLASASNPYPMVEFADTLTAGQFWPTTMVEQLAPIQSQRNRIRNTLDENLKLHTHPKIFVPQQARLHKDAWDSEAGEKIPYNFQPGMPYPQQWVVQPPPIANDVWRALEVLQDEADQVTNLYPASTGAAGATSGFDTNLLQEAADSIHAPDIRRNELALRSAAYIMRRIAKLGYDVPRLIAINGRDKGPDVFEFSSDHIDEHANIVIDTGSSLPSQKHARIEAILKLDERQAFGPMGDPTRNRKLMRMLNLGSEEEEAALVGRDEDHARLENLSFTRNEPVEDPMPWENHDLEYDIHTDLLKSPEIKGWKPEQRLALVRHVILHVKFKNPQSALQLAAMFGMADVTQEIQQTMMVQQQAQMQTAQATAPPQQQQPPQGPPPQGAPPQGPPPQGGGQPAPQAAS